MTRKLFALVATSIISALVVQLLYSAGQVYAQTQQSPPQTVATPTDWKLLVAIIAAAAGWVSAIIAGVWALSQYRARRNDDRERWQEAFVKYRHGLLQPFAEHLRTAYAKFIAGQRNVPQNWEEAAHAAKWPRNVPLPGNNPLPAWRQLYGIGLDSEDEFLFRFAESIYVPSGPGDHSQLRNRSILDPLDFDSFHIARGGIADYFDACGTNQSKQFSRFLEQRVRPNHYSYLKMVCYLELALGRALGERTQLGPGKVNLLCWAIGGGTMICEGSLRELHSGYCVWDNDGSAGAEWTKSTSGAPPTC